MSFRKALVSASVAGALMAPSVPAAFAVMADSLPQVSSVACEQLSGREQARCEFRSNRSSRVKIRTTSTPANTTTSTLSTVRQRRRLVRRQNNSDIRRIGHSNMERIRMHSRGGGNARRMIQQRMSTAARACQSSIGNGTEHALCIRGQIRQLSRGNTR